MMPGGAGLADRERGWAISTVLTMGAIGLGMVVGGLAAAPIQKMIDAEAAAPR